MIPDESQPSAFSIRPEAAAMDAAAIIAMVKPYLSKSRDGRMDWRGLGTQLSPAVGIPKGLTAQPLWENSFIELTPVGRQTEERAERSINFERS